MEEPPTSDARQVPALDIDQLIALAPRFGAWLDERAVPQDERAAVGYTEWLGTFFGENLIAGTAADLGPLLAAFDAEIFRLEQGYGGQFVAKLIYTLRVAKYTNFYLDNDLPPTLLLKWGEHFRWEEYENNFDNFTYGKYDGLSMPPYGTKY